MKQKGGGGGFLYLASPNTDEEHYKDFKIMSIRAYKYKNGK